MNSLNRLEFVIANLSDMENQTAGEIDINILKSEYPSLDEFISDINKLQIFGSTCIVDHNIFTPCKETYILRLDTDNQDVCCTRWFAENTFTITEHNSGAKCIFIFSRLNDKIYPYIIKPVLFNIIGTSGLYQICCTINKDYMKSLPTLINHTTLLDDVITELGMFDLYFDGVDNVKTIMFESRELDIRHDRLSSIVLKHLDGSNHTKIVFKYDFNFNVNQRIDYSGYPMGLQGLTHIKIDRLSESETYVYSVTEFGKEIIKLYDELNKCLIHHQVPFCKRHR